MASIGFDGFDGFDGSMVLRGFDGYDGGFDGFKPKHQCPEDDELKRVIERLPQDLWKIARE